MIPGFFFTFEFFVHWFPLLSDFCFKRFSIIVSFLQLNSAVTCGCVWQGDGNLFCGLHVDSGRVKGEMKKTLRELFEKYNLNARITPNQNIILCDIRRSWKRPITTALAQSGLLVRLKIQLSIYTNMIYLTTIKS